MHLLVLLAIVTTCAIAEQSTRQAATYPLFRITIGLALLMTFVVVDQLAARIARRPALACCWLTTLCRRTVRCRYAIWLGTTTLATLVMKWPQVVRFNLGLDTWPLVDDILLLLPALMTLWAIWFLSAHREARDSTGSAGVRQSLWTVWMQTRLFVLLPLMPVLAILLLVDVVPRAVPDATQQTQNLLAILVLLTVVVVFPELLRYAWRTQRLPAGELRMRLEALLIRAGATAKDILIWHLDRDGANAAVAGIIGRVRYVFLSAGLIDQLDDAEIEAVMAHEAGHLRHRHLACLLTSLLVPLMGMLAVDAGLRSRDGASAGLASSCVGVLAVAGFWLVVHCRYARLLEHEADLAACELLSAGSSAAPDTGSTERFIATLLRLELLGEAPAAGNWLHPTWSRRANFLRYVMRDRQGLRQFRQGMRRVHGVMIVTALLLAITWIALA